MIVFILTKLVPTIMGREVYCYVISGVCHETTPSKKNGCAPGGQEFGGCLGANKTPSASNSDWHIICAQLVFDE